VPEEKHKKKEKKTGLLQASLSKNKVHPKTLLNNVSNTIISLDHKVAPEYNIQIWNKKYLLAWTLEYCRI
jgi:hypothetical protein